MILLTLDPATSCGYCLAELSWDYTTTGKGKGWKWTSVNIYEYGIINVDTSSNFQGDHCIDLMNKIQELIDAHGVEHIGIEDFFFQKKFANGSNVNAAFRTAIHILARQNNIEYTVLNITAWKNFISETKGPTKEQKKLWGKLAKKIYIQDALWRNYGIRFPNHCISDKTSKPIGFRYDIVDVVGQAIYYCCMFCGIPKDCVECSVEIAEDVVTKMKNLYCYPEPAPQKKDEFYW